MAINNTSFDQLIAAPQANSVNAAKPADAKSANAKDAPQMAAQPTADTLNGKTGLKSKKGLMALVGAAAIGIAAYVLTRGKEDGGIDKTAQKGENQLADFVKKLKDGKIKLSKNAPKIKSVQKHTTAPLRGLLPEIKPSTINEVVQ